MLQILENYLYNGPFVNCTDGNETNSDGETAEFLEEDLED